MTLDSALLFAFLFIFVRVGAAFLSSPLLGGQTPVSIRVGFAAVTALALTPALRPYIQAPTQTYELVTALLHEVAVGLLMGLTLQFLMQSAQMAGSFMDMQMGLGSGQVMNPMLGQPVSILAQFKYLLAIIVLVSMNGHHILFRALAESYQFDSPLSLTGMKGGVLDFFGKTCILALQMSAPVAAVSIIVDAATGFVNKAVPQMQAFLVSLPAKIALGMVALALGLPVTVAAVQSGVEHSYEFMTKIIR